MMCISIRQPWAWLIVRPDLAGEARAQGAANGELKDIENRTWPTRYRGPLLIHAAKGMTRAEYEDAQDPLYHAGGPVITLPAFDQLQRGGIVGVAALVDCVPPALRESWWHMDSQFGHRLAGVRPLPFFPCKGALGIFDMPWPPAGQKSGGAAC
uniref:ASCH domain-containing protein n=1 Tax=biofilter metagenome TaxID=1070537 RepID=A0A193SBM5_9ZZZZ